MKRGRNQRRRQGMNINRALDSNGPDVRIRGTANQIYDKYLALARDASSAGDRVKAENYLQHAEHYFRLIRSIQPSQPAPSDMVDVEGDQPSLGEEGRQRRENGNGEDHAASAEPVESEGETEIAPPAPANGSAEAASEEGESEPRRPRRRRPRRQPQGDNAASESREPEDASEVTAS